VLDFGRKIAEDVPVKIRNNEHVIKAYLGEDEKTYSRLGA
jgi:ABC-type branched-subunit amino acid transport system ATPase component